jgi:stress response protein SCP2
MELMPGANTIVPTTVITLELQPFGVDASAIDFSVYTLDTTSQKVRGDDDMIFYNQPHNIAKTVSLSQKGLGVLLRFELARMSSQIGKLAICATLTDENSNFSQLKFVGVKLKNGNDTLAHAKIDGQNRLEVALIIGELYRYQGNWKFRLVAQGFKGGLKRLAQHYGVTITEIENPLPVASAINDQHLPSEANRNSPVSSSLKDILLSPLKAIEKHKKLKEFQTLLNRCFSNHYLGIPEQQSLIQFCSQNQLSLHEALASAENQVRQFMLLVASQQPKTKLERWGIFLNVAQPTMQKVFQLVHEKNERRFIDMLTHALSDGQLTNQEIDQLDQFCNSHQLNKQPLLLKATPQINNFLHFTLASIISDKIVTPEEQALIDHLCDFLKPTRSMLEEIRTTIAKVNSIAKIRKGDVIPIRTNAIISKNSEIVYLHQPYVRLPHGKHEILHGDLFVTSERLIYKATKSMEVPISNIIALESNANVVFISAKTKRGSGEFYIGKDAEIVEAYIEQAIKRFHRQLDLQQTAGASRHISQSVKNAVWLRCQGRCVQCASTQYLEFDHIIPFSKGGSNSENNIQILCRACNLAKSNQI